MGHDHGTNDHGSEPHRSQVLAAPDSDGDSLEQHLDRSAFDELIAELGREDTLQTFAVFFGEADTRVTRLRELLRDLNGDEIKRQAHALKGSAANFGFRRVSDLAKILEEDARAVAPERYAALLQALERSYATARLHFSKLAV
jgi:HPt (histidine-containing phosphotransfer) domain-containing protein